jgi:hypothetical protein
MKRLFVYIFIFLLSQAVALLPSYGQLRLSLENTGMDYAQYTEEDKAAGAEQAYMGLLHHFLQVESIEAAHLQRAETEFAAFCHKLEQLQAKQKSDAWFLEKLFTFTQKAYLHTFADYEALSKVLNQKTYNCVSATALYALLLDRFGYRYEVKATPFHCYLLVYSGKHTYLFESTDPVYGFVREPLLIRDMETQYLEDAREGMQMSGVPSQFTTLMVSADLKNLCGLMYYNSAVKMYNKQQAEQALQMLYKAHAYYPSPWITSFIDHCLNQLFADAATRDQHWQALTSGGVSKPEYK